MPGPTVVEPNVVAVSIPYSGVRTLREILGLSTHQHFGSEARYFKTNADHVHIPIRHPFSVAESWARRQRKVEDMLRGYREMFEFIETGRPMQLWHMEKQPRLKGINDKLPGGVPPFLAKIERDVIEYIERVRCEVVEQHREFFDIYGYQ